MISGSNAQGSRLAVLRPDSTDMTLAFTASINTEITNIFVANTTGSTATFRICHVGPLDIADENNALFWDVEVLSGDTQIIFADSPNAGVTLAVDDTLHVRTDTADALTFTLYGVTATIAQQLGGVYG